MQVFNPATAASVPAFADFGFVHIPRGLDDDFSAIDGLELRGLRVIDGRLRVWPVVERRGVGFTAGGMEKVRRLAERGVIDLVAPSTLPWVGPPEFTQCQTS